MTTIDSLRCEYHVSPIGIDVLLPRLSWITNTDARNWKQAAYQILAASSESALHDNQGDLWDSGRVESDQSIHVAYAGKALASMQRVYWKVRVWGGGEATPAESTPAFFEIGLLNRSQWKGQWIGGRLAGAPFSPPPCPYLRKTFAADRPIKAARLYITALGVYEASLNGQRVGQEFFRPGWTEYTKRVQYDVYDVTAMLAKGPNAIGVILADGWYAGRVGSLPRQQYGRQPMLLAQLRIDYEAGPSDWIVTDQTWKTSTGPILQADLIGGEHYDARAELPGWDTAHFNEVDWQPAKTFADPGVPIVGRTGPAVRRVKQLKPIAPAVPAKRLAWQRRGVLFDLGQNMVGVVRIKVTAKAGTTIRLRHGEMLNEHGALYTANLRTAEQTDYYTCRGGGEETYTPRFTFHGFRYVEVVSVGEDATFELNPDDGVVGLVMHSDTPETGTFECSDPLINQLQSNIQWGQRGNFLEVPTDCPQRDERLGWTGDAQVFIRTAAWNMDVAGFFTKWQNDIADSMTDQGSVPMTIPRAGLGGDGGAAWADAVLICPWTIHLCYGDTKLLASHFESFQRFVNFLSETSRDGIRGIEGAGANPGFGDWLALDGSGKVDGGTPKDLISTAFYARSAWLMADMARVLGKPIDQQRYEKLFEQIKTAFNHRYVTPAGLIAAQTQTAAVLALHFDLLPEALRLAAANWLVADIKKRGNHLATGFVGTPYLCEVLTRFGHLDVAYDLLNQKTWPSWLYSVTQGGTTIWERWNGWTKETGFADVGMNSYNHYAYGAIGQWLYDTVAGISPLEPAYKKILVRPCPGGGLTHAKATLKSTFGQIASSWTLTGGQFTLDVTIPPNTTATIHLPDETKHEVGSGAYRYTVRP